MELINKVGFVLFILCSTLSINNANAQCAGTANFTYVDNGNGNYTFTDTSTPTGWPIVSWQWNFGSINDTSSAQNPVKTFLANFYWSVKLEITDSSGCIDSITQIITVTSLPCNTSFTTTDNGGGNYSFNSTLTGVGPFIPEYNFGDGDSSYVADTNHTFLSFGTYYVNFGVFDLGNSLCFSIFRDTIVYGNACNVTPSFTSTDNGNWYFSFNNTTTGFPASYLWNFGDGDTSTVQNASHFYPAMGSYTVELAVTDTGGCTVSYYDTIRPSCGVIPDFTYVDNGSGNYTFTNTSSYPNSSGGAKWNFGDGTLLDTFGIANPNHTFLSNSTFAVVLAATDTVSGIIPNGYCWNYHIELINVVGVASPVQCNAAYVTFTDSTSSDVYVFNNSIGNNLTYLWNFGDGDTSTLAYPSHTYAGSGPYYLCLTVDDGAGCVDMFCDSIGENGIVYKQTGFIINVSAPMATSIADQNNVIAEFNVYPNPFKDNLTIELNLIEQTYVEIFITDLLGNLVSQVSNKELNVGNNKLHWKSGNVSNGIYLLNVKTNNSLQVKKLVLNK